MMSVKLGIVSRVYCDQDKILCAMKGFSPFSGFPDGGVHYSTLTTRHAISTRHVVTTDVVGLVGWAFSCKVGTRVRYVTRWAYVCRGVAIPLGKLAII